MSRGSALGRVLERSRLRGREEGGLTLDEVARWEEPPAGATKSEEETWQSAWESLRDKVRDQSPEAETALEDLEKLEARLLTAVQVRTDCQGLWQEFENTLARVPDIVQRLSGSEHPAMTTITEVVQAARTYDESTDFAKLEERLEPAASAQEAFAAAVERAQEPLQRIAQLHRVFSDELKSSEGDLKKLGDKLYAGDYPKLSWTTYVAKAERAVVPENREMTRGTGEEILTRLRKLFDAGFLEIDAGSKIEFYESSYDRAVDQFGGSWSLKSRGMTGKTQWLQAWEFHIHGRATRPDDDQPVDGFEILAGHIKPTKAKMTTGNSISVPTTHWPKVINDSRDKFVRWARKPEAAEILRGKKRG